ncbi:MAG: hypothetical protein ACK5NY_06575 [Burkholderiaceae bacterium]
MRTDDRPKPTPGGWFLLIGHPCAKTYGKPTRRAAGFVTAYVLYGVALLAVLAAGYAFVNREGDSARVTAQVRVDLQAQANMIRTKLVTCSLQRITEHAEAVIADYPATPADGLIRSVNCNDATVTAPGEVGDLWKAGDGLAPPLSPSGFGNWQYLNDGSDVAFMISSLDGSARSLYTLQTVANRFGSTLAKINGSTLKIYVKKVTP